MMGLRSASEIRVVAPTKQLDAKLGLDLKSDGEQVGYGIKVKSIQIFGLNLGLDFLYPVQP